MLEALKEAYGEAVRQRKAEFEFNGKVYATAYARHVIRNMERTTA